MTLQVWNSKVELCPTPQPPTLMSLPPSSSLPHSILTPETQVWPPPQPQLLRLLSSWHCELGRWQLSLPRVRMERQIPEVETCRADKICFSKPRWCQMKNLRNRSLWPEVNEGFQQSPASICPPRVGGLPHSCSHWLFTTSHSSHDSRVNGDPQEPFSVGKTIGKGLVVPSSSYCPRISGDKKSGLGYHGL